MNEQGNIEFRELTGNTAPSTVLGKKIAKANFNKFLVLSGNELLEELDEETLCDPSLLRKYATYLVEHYVTKDDKHLMCDSAKQYISGVFVSIQERFPRNVYYDTGAQVHNWYARLRSDLDNEITLRCIELGEEVASKSYPVGRELLLNEGLLHRFDFILQFSSGGGRSGESALVSSNGCYWDTILTTFTLNWNQKKLRRQDICNYINDWEYYEIDFS